MKTAMLMLAALLTGAFVSACCGCERPVRTAEDLHGVWGNLDAGTHRVFVFGPTDAHPELAGRDDAYLLYEYGDGEAPRLVQRGTYDVRKAALDGPGGVVETRALITTITWADTPGMVGQTFGNPLEDWGGQTFTLGHTSGPGGYRTFDRMSDLP